jgi:4-hydroxy-4-methyl-2-oxoglutarate aldolase
MEFTLSQKEEILNLYDKMRVTDVRDGMDWMGYHHYGSMSEKMRPLWPTKAMGFAKTSRINRYDQSFNSIVMFDISPLLIFL